MASWATSPSCPPQAGLVVTVPCPHPPKPLLPAVAQLSLGSSPSPGLGPAQSRAWEVGHLEEGPPVPTHGSPCCHGPRRL